MVLQAIGAGATIAITISAIDKFSAVFNKAGAAGKAFGIAISAIGVAVVGTTVALASLGKSALDSGIAMETAMVGVAKTTGLADEEIAKLRGDFIELSKVMPVSAQGLATIGEVAGQLGIVGRDNIKSFTETVSKMAIATELTEESAALALAKISTAMGLPIEESEKLGSAINELSNISAASSTEIVSAMVRVAGSARTLGLSTENVSGMTAALIASGEPAERAGTKLRSAFDMVIKKVDEASKFMGTDFKKALEEDANGAILSLINEISKVESPVERQQQAMDLFGTVGASAINKLTTNLPEMNRLIAASTGEFENATSLQKEYDKASKSTASQIQILKNNFEAMKLEISDKMLPVFGDLIKSLREDVLPAIQPLVPLIADFLTGALKGLIPIIKSVAIWFSNVAQVFFNKVVPAIRDMLPFYKDVFNITKAFLGPIIKFSLSLFKLAFNITKFLMPGLRMLAKLVLFLLKPFQFMFKIITGITDAIGSLFGVVAKEQNKMFKELDFFGDKEIKSRLTLISPDAQKTSEIAEKTKTLEIIKLNDFILNNGKTFQPITIGTKDEVGNNFVFNIDKIQGADPDDIAEALQTQLKNIIRI